MTLEIRKLEPMSSDELPTAKRTCPASVAYELMRDILLDDPRRPAPSSPEFRVYLLDLYAECLAAVRGKRTSAPPTKAKSYPRPHVAA